MDLHQSTLSCFCSEFKVWGTQRALTLPDFGVLVEDDVNTPRLDLEHVLHLSICHSFVILYHDLHLGDVLGAMVV